MTYTPESWRYLNDQLAERYPEETAVMVGWYHTHPGFGIFLSGMDQFIHQNLAHRAGVRPPRPHKRLLLLGSGANARRSCQIQLADMGGAGLVKG